MKNKWERRDAKEQNKKNFISDNRRSVQISARMWLEPNKLKQDKKKKYRQGSINSRMLSLVDKLNLVANRPRNMVMNVTKIEKLLNKPMPKIKDCINKLAMNINYE